MKHLDKGFPLLGVSDSPWHLALGKFGEEEAIKLLKKLGYRIVENNWRAGNYGEIDVVAIENETLVFVEVKTRSSKPLLKPYEAVTPHKIDNLKKAGFLYSRNHPELPQALRIDVVSIELQEDKDYSVEVFKGVG